MNTETGPVGMTPETEAHKGPLSEPPRLTRIRMPAGEGSTLNKRMILILAGGGALTILLIFASTLSPPAAAPATTGQTGAIRPLGPDSAARRIRGPASYADLTPAPSSDPKLDVDMSMDMEPFDPLPDEDEINASGWSAWDASGDDEHPAPGGWRNKRPMAPPEETLIGGPAKPSEPPTPPASPDLFFTLKSPASAPGPQITKTTQEAARIQLSAGTVIQASLITSVHSGLGGPVMAQVLRPVLDSRTGLQEAIPAGTRVIGETRASPRFGERRIAIIWSRLILPDGREIALDDPALDAAGRTGIPARTDNHWGDLFGAALLGTLISAGAAAAEDAGRDEILIGGQEGALRGREPRGILAEGVATTASAASARVLDRSLALAPTLTAETGSRVSILVNRTMEF